MVILKSEKSVSLADGVHVGKISGLSMRTGKTTDNQEYSYLDIEIEAETLKIKCSMSSKLNPNSELGKTLVRFGYDSRTFGEGEVDIDKILIGKTIQFKTATEESKKNGKFYSNVVASSINPIQA